MSGDEGTSVPANRATRAQPVPDLTGSYSVDIVCFKCKGTGATYVKSRKRPRRQRGGGSHNGGADRDHSSVAGRSAGAGEGEERGPPPKAGALPVPGNTRLWTVPCGVCGGCGKMQPRKTEVRRVDRSSGCKSFVHREFGLVAVPACKAPPGWQAPGPTPFAETPDGEDWHRSHVWSGQGGEAGEGEALVAATELCMLCGSWRIHQPVRGHRYSTDDLVTAWYAAQAYGRLLSADGPTHCLDLGCGIGSVLLMLAWSWPRARCVGVEAQRERHALARASAAYNTDPRSGRVHAVGGDLRAVEQALVAGGDEEGVGGSTPSSATPPGGFDLVTGTPPYWEAANAALPSDMGRARCLYEFFGGVEEYCTAAAPLLSPDTGLFVVCAAGTAADRVERGAADAGLTPVARLDVVPREGKPPLFSVYAMARAGSGAARGALEAARELGSAGIRPAGEGGRSAGDGAPLHEEITVRRRDGQRTPAYAALLSAMGKPQ